MAQFRYAALPANIFRSVALCSSGMSPTAQSAARGACVDGKEAHARLAGITSSPSQGSILQ
jgi:hypothetical protein